jgi:hypothetical protein
LYQRGFGVSSPDVNGKLALPLLLIGVLALTRIPGMLPENFSAVYALVFCAGIYLPGRISWWAPLAVLAGTDLLLNCYYRFHLKLDVFNPTLLIYLLGNYAAYLAILGLGRRFTARTAWWKLLAGGLMGALLFYLITNTVSWFFNPFGNPEYTRNLAGWLRALTLGTAGWPETWTFLRNTLSSGGLFTGLFVGAMKLAEKLESEKEEESESTEEDASEPQAAAPEESKA